MRKLTSNKIKRNVVYNGHLKVRLKHFKRCLKRYAFRNMRSKNSQFYRINNEFD
jgi:hypothetical protein